MNKTIFIGQAMPRFKKDPHDWPSLNTWLYSIRIDQNQIQKNFLYSALVDYFPGAKNGSHLVPTPVEIENERYRLVKTILAFSPKIVVPIGKLSISYCLNQTLLPLGEAVGKIFKVDPYLALGYEVLVLPLPHPSGASTWRHNPKNKELLSQALNLLKQII